MEHLRRHTRFEANAPAELKSLGDSAELVHGRVVDISESGFRLLLPRSLPLGEPIRIEVDGDIYIGEVRNLTFQEGDWLTGVELAHWIPKSTIEELRQVWGPKRFRTAATEAAPGSRRLSLPAMPVCAVPPYSSI